MNTQISQTTIDYTALVNNSNNRAEIKISCSLRSLSHNFCNI